MTINLVGLRFRSEPNSGLVFIIDRVSRTTVHFHARPSNEPKSARSMPWETLLGRLDARYLVILSSPGDLPYQASEWPEIRRALVADYITIAAQRTAPFRGSRPVASPERQPTTLPARRSASDFRAAILHELAAGPLMKWELRERLHEPEVHVLKHLQALKRDRLVKVVGRVLDKRKWALIDWQDPKPNPFNAPSMMGELRTTIATVPKPKPEKDSWWTKHAAPDADRSAFSSDLETRRRDPAIAHALEGSKTATR